MSSQAMEAAAARAVAQQLLRNAPYDDMSFGAAFNAAKAEGRKTFPWKGQTYTTETREERTQKAYSDTSRRQDVAPKAAPSAAPAARPRASVSDIPGLLARGVSEGAERVPVGRGLGAAFTAAGAARGAGRAALAATAKPKPREDNYILQSMRRRNDDDIAAGREPSYPELSRSVERVEPPLFKHGGKVKAYKSGGSVKGSGCEQRGLRKCKVY